jgi:hypothetical protein
MDTCYLSYPFTVDATSNRSKHLWGYSFTADGAITDTVVAFRADFSPGPNAVVDWGFWTDGDAYFGDTTKTARLVATTSIHCSGDITADTVKAAVKGNVVGDLTGNATTASTCTTWTGAATKVDTNDAAIYRQSDSVSDCYANSTKQWGDASAPSFWEPDTISVSRCFVSGCATGTDPWKFVWISCTGDTLAKHTSTTSGYWNWDSTMTATILPTGGIWTKWEEKTTGTDQGRVKQGINYYSVNP